MNRREDIRARALTDLQKHEVLMLNGHFDFGNGYHGRLYLNPHQLFRYPSTIWRFAQDLIDVLPASIVDQAEVVAGPIMGGALLPKLMGWVADVWDMSRGFAVPMACFLFVAFYGFRWPKLANAESLSGVKATGH